MKQRLYNETRVGERLEPLRMEINTTKIVAGAMASRDYSPLHHDLHYAKEQAGHRDIFMNSPQQASLLERYLGDWSGPLGRLGRLRLAMRSPVYAGDTLEVRGEISDRFIDEQSCAWVKLELELRVGDMLANASQARYALPLTDQDNPWLRRGEEWQP